MFNEDDDDDFFTPTTSSNLASLFRMSVSSSNYTKSDLTYTAPRQPKLNTEDSPKNAKVESKAKQKKTSTHYTVLYAKPVNLYKLMTSGAYGIVAKLGLAIIGDQLQVTEFMLYKDKQNIVLRVKVSPTFQFFLQDNNFISFIDDNKTNWSMHFENVKDLDDFLHQLQLRNVTVKNCIKNNDDTSKSDITDSMIDINKMDVKTDPQDVNIQEESKDKLNIEEKNSAIVSSSSHTSTDILTRMAKMGQSVLPNPKIDRNYEKNNSTEVNQKINTKPKSQQGQSNLPPEVSVDNPLSSDKKLPDPLENCQTQHLPGNENRDAKSNLDYLGLTSKMDTILEEITKLKSQTSSENLQGVQSEIARLLAVVKYRNTSECLLQPKEFQLKIAELSKKLTEIETSTSECKNLIKTDVLLHERNGIENHANKPVLIDKDETLKQIELELNKCVMNHESALNNALESKTKLLHLVNSLHGTIVNLNLKLKDYESYFYNTEKMKTKLKYNNELKLNEFTDTTKQSMNVMFQNIMQSFDDASASYQSADIRNILGSHMKLTTYEIILNYQECLDKFDLKSLMQEFQLPETTEKGADISAVVST